MSDDSIKSRRRELIIRIEEDKKLLDGLTTVARERWVDKLAVAAEKKFG